ncbi:MAG: phenylacetate--CoA ligase family protein [Kiritimatiellia bacterium]
MDGVLDIWRYRLYDPLHHGAVLRQWRDLSASQWWPRAELEAMQGRELDRLLEHAKRFVPYYAAALADDSGSSGVSCRDRLARLPILTKETVRTRGADLASRDGRGGKIHVSRTGGSTGEPLVVATGTAGVVAAQAAVLRGRDWAGVRLGDWGASLKAHGRISLAGRWKAGLIRLRPFASSLSREHLLNDVIPALKSSPPRYLAGYPTSLLGLAALLGEGELRISAILSTGEMLYPEQRAALERIFAGRVFDSYGSNEVASIAFECEHGRKHVTDEQVLLEVVDDSGQPVWDAPGRILVTDLRNRAMPFIRYELGDLGTLVRKPCPCGRHLLVLKELEGRTQDALCGPNGARMSGVFFAGRFRDLERIRAYQVVQTSATDVTLRYVPAAGDAEPEVREIAAVIRDRLGPEMRVETARCDDLPLTRAGKTRLVVGWKAPEGAAP